MTCFKVSECSLFLCFKSSYVCFFVLPILCNYQALYYFTFLQNNLHGVIPHDLSFIVSNQSSEIALHILFLTHNLRLVSDNLLPRKPHVHSLLQWHHSPLFMLGSHNFEVTVIHISTYKLLANSAPGRFVFRTC